MEDNDDVITKPGLCRSKVKYAIRVFVVLSVLLSLLGMTYVDVQTLFNRKYIQFINDAIFKTKLSSANRWIQDFPDPKTPAVAVEKILYNRVPKCGSSSTIRLFDTLSYRNNYTFINTKESFRLWKDNIWQSNLTLGLGTISRPLVFEKHMHFVDFTKFGADQPAYINLVRDPVERMISWYYFRRFRVGHARRMPPLNRLMTFDECVLQNNSECVEPNGNSPELGYFKIIPFFCGMDEFCRFDPEQALKAAIDNVRKHYKIVGVTEEHEAFIEALEYLYPRFFKGATQTFQTLVSQIDNFKNAGRLKDPVSKKAREKMKRLMKYEYVFYNFVRDRFHEVLQNISIAKKHKHHITK